MPQHNKLVVHIRMLTSFFLSDSLVFSTSNLTIISLTTYSIKLLKYVDTHVFGYLQTKFKL